MSVHPGAVRQPRAGAELYDIIEIPDSSVLVCASQLNSNRQPKRNQIKESDFLVRLRREQMRLVAQLRSWFCL